MDSQSVWSVDRVNEDERCSTTDGTSKMGSQSCARAASRHAVSFASCKLGRCDRGSHNNRKPLAEHLADSGSAGIEENPRVQSWEERPSRSQWAAKVEGHC